MKILVIFTGGTIGSSKKGEYTLPDKKNNYLLIDNYTSKHGKSVDFCTLEALSMLSENLSHAELNTIIKSVYDNLDKDYDGIIVTHGTDSLQYTSCALGFCFPSINIPIVLVSSRYPLSHPEQNGDDNFLAAVEFIKAKQPGGVYVSYRNQGCESTHIHFATRVFSHLEITDSLYSIDSQYCASYKNGVVTPNTNFKRTGSHSTNNCYKFCPDSAVLIINSVPGDNFSYNLDGKKAVLLRSYHSGTVNTASPQFRAFCKKAKELGVPVFLPRACIETAYESTELFEPLSVKYLPCMTFVSAYVKLWLANSIGSDLNEFMYEPINSEFIV